MMAPGQLRLVVQPLLERPAAQATRQRVEVRRVDPLVHQAVGKSAAAAVITPAMTTARDRNAVVDQLRCGVRTPTTRLVATPNAARNDTVPAE